MFWRLVFKKVVGPRMDGDLLGYDYQKIAIMTDSFLKRQDLIKLYKDKDFSLIKCEEHKYSLAPGHNGMPVKSEWWFPDLEEYEKHKAFPDLTPVALKQPPPRSKSATPLVAEPIPEALIQKQKTLKSTFIKKKDGYKCPHTLNCGMKPIYAMPTFE